MSYERWITDGQELAGQITTAGETYHKVSQLLTEIALLGVQVPAYYANTGIMHSDSLHAEFIVACDDPSSAKNRVHLSEQVIASVSNDFDRPILYLPDYRPKNTLGNGILVIHELVHIDQSLRGSLRSFPEEPSEIEKHIGKAEREAYGINLQILKAIDGEEVDDYFDGWPRDIMINEQGDRRFGGIYFKEKALPIVPTPKHTVYTWENLSTIDRAWNLIATRKVLLKGFPKPKRGTFMRELWQEGDFSKKFLRSIGRMSVLEASFQGKLASDEIDAIAGATFSCQV